MTELLVPDPRCAVAATVRASGGTAARAPEEVAVARESGPAHVRAVFTAGELASRATLIGEPMVMARDSAGCSWWIAASAVWADFPAASAGEPARRPAHPHAVGLAVGSSWSGALLAGLSDRLGWEAVAGLPADSAPSARLPGLGAAVRAELLDDPACAAVAKGHDVQLLDGRCTTVPTVVIAGDGVLRWGAGATWAAALQRALFGDAAVANQAASSEVELQVMAAKLADDGIEVVGVDLGTATLGAAGITRLSVQLVASRGVGGD